MSQWLPVADLASQVNSGKLKASDLVDKSLKLIKDKSEYKAIIATTDELAKKRAAEIDAKVKDNQNAGRLAGVPFIAKDNFLAYGANTTAASNILKNFDAPYQAVVIEKLEAEGAICVAKANLDAFGHGNSTENSDFFTSHNPHDKTRVPGGSSGGSATAVVLGVAPFAIGTDTGGSIRQPSSLSGCVGYKPTYGLVSRSGVIAMASSTDVIGPLTNSVDDAALVLDVMAGKDELDSTTITSNKNGYVNLSGDLKGKKFGIVREHMGEGVQTGIIETIDNVVKQLKGHGAEVTEVNLPSLALSLGVYYIICPAEVSSNLSRYDGQRYGYSDESAKDLNDVYMKSRGIGFGAEAKRRIMIGTYVLSSGYYDAYYKKAQTVRTKLINEFREAFKKVDYLIGPVAPTTAFKIGELSSPLQMYLQDLMTVAASLTGMPSVSLPAGEIDGLPVGIQVMASQSDDRNLLETAKQIEGILNE